MNLEEYTRLDGVAMAELVREGQVTPTELVEHAIALIERHDPALHALVHTDLDRARAQAAAPLPEGPFTGVPMLLKDLGAEDEGQPSTSSCSLGAGWRAPADCELVRRFKASGAIVLGRTNTPEMGIMGTTEPSWRGPTHNPWSLDHSPGGSSGGSGAAVAARLVPFAHGGDGGGSIRIPSSDCGLFGLKPTRARVPEGPYVGERWSGLVSQHVLTRSVRDSAVMLDAIHGPDPGAPYQVEPPQRPYTQEVGSDPGKLSIGFTTAALFGKETHPECAAAVHSTVELLQELGHEVAEVELEYDQAELVRYYLYVVATGTAEGLRDMAQRAGRPARASDVEPSTWLLASIGKVLPALELERSRSVMHAQARKLASFYERHDLLLTPTVARPPVKLGELDLSSSQELQIRLLSALGSRKLLMVALDQLAQDALSRTPNTQLFNLTGQPAMSVPLHWTPEGLPTGSHFVARFGDEATLFRLAAQLEQARPWADRLPSLLAG